MQLPSFDLNNIPTPLLVIVVIVIVLYYLFKKK